MRREMDLSAGAAYSSSSSLPPHPASSRSSYATASALRISRPVKVIPLQHPSIAASSKPSVYGDLVSRWTEKVRRMTWTEWIELSLPCFRWIRKYRWRQDLQPDLISGVTVGVMLVPQVSFYIYFDFEIVSVSYNLTE
ncbi:unnamed protein product [Cuscuta campestris]|uniref:SLC26A/SulP transporter domain-containing protein n=1 Tax=Cuscuta campestris TaxID=132261 RepID=A0A484LXF5_9ASTE|nr:unnamed protein product [Cuscuta campestris]